jgi:hypothetical protein
MPDVKPRQPAWTAMANFDVIDAKRSGRQSAVFTATASLDDVKMPSASGR